jgi:purine-binding chemotaxis protein CheW
MDEAKLDQFVVFRIGKELYALDTKYIIRIENDKKVRPVPNTKEEIKGIITVEEDIVPLVDLRIKFRIESKKEKEIPYIIVCKIKEKDIVVGFIVDDVIVVKDIPSNADLGSISETITGSTTEYIKGIYRPSKEENKTEEKGQESKLEEDDELLIILNINKLLGLEIEKEVKNISEK